MSSPHTADEASAQSLLQAELNQLMALVQEYLRLSAGEASSTDLGARVGRIGGRMQAILRFERELLLPRLDDAPLRRTALAQLEDVWEHLEQLAAQSAEGKTVSGAEMLALASHFEAHLQLFTERLWPALDRLERQPAGEELAEWRARWRQDEAAD